jgi:uncharacterized repeat protein (TIGR02543 family)
MIFMNFKTILVLLCFVVAIVGIIAPVNAAAESVSESKAFTIESKEKSAKIKIRLDGNGGKFPLFLRSPAKVVSKSINKGSKIGNFPTAPRRDGYVFEGYFTKKTSGSKISASTKPTKPVTYYAQWSKKPYTLTFNANGGSVTPYSKKIVEKKNLGELPEPTRYDHTFDGWYTAKSGGTKVTSATKMSAKDMVIYAQWTRNPTSDFTY